MLTCNPRREKVVEIARESLFFRKDTWHHVRAQVYGAARFAVEFFRAAAVAGTSGSCQ